MMNDLIYNPVSDDWSDDSGKTYIKNEFNPEYPQWLDISTSYWCLSYNGRAHYIDWDSIDLPVGLLLPLMEVTKEKLKRCAPDHLGMTRSWLTSFVKLADPLWTDFGDISSADMADVWQGLVPQYRLHLRGTYRTMADLGIGGAKPYIAAELRQWKARHQVQVLRDVLRWDEMSGALTSSEEKVLRDTLDTDGGRDESDRDHGVRIFGWLLLDTLKRSSQVLGILKDGIREITDNNGASEWFVEIQPIKYQTGLPLRWWHISEKLAKEIIEYKKRESVVELQNRFDRLIVWDTKCLFNHGEISAADAKATFTRYIETKRMAISPRTGKLLHVTPRRIRHTGATRMAFQGVSRDVIQEILEHDSPESAQAYIDAVGSEIVPAIEKAGRLMGNIFFELNKGFFQGRVIHDLGNEPPIVVPEFTPTPIIVGTCSRDTLKEGVCPKHPFLSCYNGCACFFAWDNPDPHSKALFYFEKEISRWEKSIEVAKRETAPHLIADRTLEMYQQAATATKEVLIQIEKGKS